MAKIAVDVVLLPSERMIDKAIQANRELLKKFDKKIILDKKNCLPHISLAMGRIDEKDIPDIEGILQAIAKRCSLRDLTVIGTQSAASSTGETVSVFQIEKTNQLQSLHEEIMGKLAPYFGRNVTGDMIYGCEKVEQSTLLWIRDYPQKSSFENFCPHITIGFGQISDFSFPIKFTASKLALCHLGNHCTCRKILVSTELKS